MATSPAVNHSGVRHEKRDANIPALAIFAGVLCLTIAAVLIGMRFLFFSYATPQARKLAQAPFATTRILPSEPRLQPHPEADLAIYLQAQKKDLATYGWVDRRNGVVRIPIGRAMQLLLKQGLPVQASAGSPQPAHQDANRKTKSDAGDSRAQNKNRKR